jgi:hypothetical protein
MFEVLFKERAAVIAELTAKILPYRWVCLSSYMSVSTADAAHLVGYHQLI